MVEFVKETVSSEVELADKKLGVVESSRKITEVIDELREVLYGNNLIDKFSVITDLLFSNAKAGDVVYDYFMPHLHRDEQLRFYYNKLLEIVNCLPAEYERYKVVNAPLLGLIGVPEFPTLEKVKRSILSQLTLDQVKYMLEDGRSQFGFQLKLVTPTNRVDLLNILINSQPHTMDTIDREQGNLFVKPGVLGAWNSSQSGLQDIHWRWEFYQNSPFLNDAEAWDEPRQTLRMRMKKFHNQLPDGVTGSDRFSWATAMAAGLVDGKPLDVRFTDDATNLFDHLGWGSTVLDQEKMIPNLRGDFSCIDGTFSPDDRRVLISEYFSDWHLPTARFRASVGGPVE